MQHFYFQVAMMLASLYNTENSEVILGCVDFII